MEVDLRRAGSSCIDNPVIILAFYLEKGVPLTIILKRDQLAFVEEMLEASGYTIVRQEEGEDFIKLVAVKKM